MSRMSSPTLAKCSAFQSPFGSVTTVRIIEIKECINSQTLNYIVNIFMIKSEGSLMLIKLPGA